MLKTMQNNTKYKINSRKPNTTGSRCQAHNFEIDKWQFQCCSKLNHILYAYCNLICINANICIHGRGGAHHFSLLSLSCALLLLLRLMFAEEREGNDCDTPTRIKSENKNKYNFRILLHHVYQLNMSHHLEIIISMRYNDVIEPRPLLQHIFLMFQFSL